jgi:hypothetical protein
MAIELPKQLIPDKMLAKVNKILDPTRMKVLKWRSLDDNIARIEAAVIEHEMQLAHEKKALAYLNKMRKRRKEIENE